MANLITGSRIILSVIMLFFPTGSCSFYCCYLFAGITDMIDGTVARIRKETSEFGSRLDAIADIVFVAVSVYKLLPILNLSIIVWIWTGVIAVIKVNNMISGYIIKKQFVPVHTAANKLTGLLLFLLPLSATVIDTRYSSIVICMVATFAATQEGHFIRSGQ